MPTKLEESAVSVEEQFAAIPLLAYLGARAMAGVEEVAGGVYRRVLRTPVGPRIFEVDLAKERRRRRGPVEMGQECSGR